MILQSIVFYDTLATICCKKKLSFSFEIILNNQPPNSFLGSKLGGNKS